MKSRYTVVFEKSEGWWAVHVEGLPGALTQGRTLNEARENIKEAIAMIVEANNNQIGGATVEADDVLREDVVVTFVKQPAANKPRKPRRAKPAAAAGR